MPVIDTVEDLSPKAFMELVAKLQPFFAPIRPKGISGGDYVFIDEQTVENDGDPIVFTAIPQTFRHLVVELEAVSTYEITPSVPSDNPDDITVEWGNASVGDFYGDDYVWGAGWVSQTPDTWEAENNTWEGTAIPIRAILPAKNINGAGSPSNAVCRAVVTLKWPYYARTDMCKNVLWEAAAQVQQGGADSAGNFTSTYGAVNVGGGQNGFDAEPLDRIRLAAKNTGFLAGSAASLYGIV